MEYRKRSRDEPDRRWRLWMIAAQAGDSATYEKLLLELLPYIRRQLVGRVRDSAEREDTVQNVLISVHRARHTYRPEHPFVPWLRAVVRNASIDWMRARGRRSRHEWGGDVDEMPERSYEAPLPGEDALSPELEGALASLPASQREAVELLHVEGLSVAEAAERVGVSPGALKVRAHRGYRALRALLSRREP
jgi:RNA polymerase sigma-70 factor (ECF subfamily)